jgi:predicted MFS family arabinose efflux permease
VNAPEGDAKTDPNDPYRWVILVVATLAQTGTAVLFLGVGALAGFIQEDFDLSGAQTGLLVTAIGLAAVIALLPTGRLLDRRSERMIITAGALILAAGAALAALSNTYGVLLMILLIGGGGYSASQPGGSKVVAAWFPAHQRGVAMGIRQTGLPLGGAIAAAILPAVADRWDWRAALLVAAAFAAGSGVLFGLAYRPPADPVLASVPGFRTELGGLFRSKGVRLAMQSGLAMVSMQFVIISYLMLYLRDVHGVPLTRGAWMLFGAQGGGVAGRIVLAAWSDRVSNRMLPVVVAAAAAALGACGFAALASGPSFSVLLVVSIGVGFFAFGWYGPWVVYVAEAASAHAVGMTLALAMTANQLAIVIAPPVFGLLLDLSSGYLVPWLVMAGFLALSAVRVGLAARSRPMS